MENEITLALEYCEKQRHLQKLIAYVNEDFMGGFINILQEKPEESRPELKLHNVYVYGSYSVTHLKNVGNGRRSDLIFNNL